MLLKELSASVKLSGDKIKELLQLRKLQQEAVSSSDPRQGEAEQAMEIIEGTARFVEVSFYTVEPAIDRLLKARPATAQPQIEEEIERGFSVAQDNYFYATGFSLCWLLQRCVPSWRERLDSEGYDRLLESCQGNQ